MRERFFSGLIFLFPLAITLWCIKSSILFLTGPFQGFSELLLQKTDMFPNGLGIFSHDELVAYTATLAILFTLVIATIIIGYLAKKYVSSRFFRFLDEFFMHIPFINSVYTLMKKITKPLLSEKNSLDSHVTLAPFIHSEQKSVYIITNTIVMKDQAPHAVAFLPTALNPTIGILLLLPKSTLDHPLDMSVEDAFRFVISCGASPLPKVNESTVQ